MILSVSRRTDIPNFYSDWFIDLYTKTLRNTSGLDIRAFAMEAA